MNSSMVVRFWPELKAGLKKTDNKAILVIYSLFTKYCKQCTCFKWQWSIHQHQNPPTQSENLLLPRELIWTPWSRKSDSSPVTLLALRSLIPLAGWYKRQWTDTPGHSIDIPQKPASSAYLVQWAELFPVHGPGSWGDLCLSRHLSLRQLSRQMEREIRDSRSGDSFLTARSSLSSSLRPVRKVLHLSTGSQWRKSKTE